MVASIKIKRSDTAGNPPVLGAGELAYSGLPDNGANGGDRLYIGMGVETNDNAVNHLVIGGKYFTDLINASTNLKTPLALVRRDVTGSINVSAINADTLNVSSNAVITGNLTVQGTTTTINSTVVEISDLNVVIAKDATNATAANGAGLTVNGPTIKPTLLYSSIDDRWNFNKNLNIDIVYGSLDGNATTATTLATGRTIGISGDITYTSPSFNGSGNITAVATLATVNDNIGTWNTVTVNGKGLVTGGSNTGYLTSNQTITASGDISGSGNTALSLTLATVNSNVGTFGSDILVPKVTVNGKGLITAVSTTMIPTASTTVKGLASFATANFDVDATGIVSLSSIDGGSY